MDARPREVLNEALFALCCHNLIVALRHAEAAHVALNAPALNGGIGGEVYFKNLRRSRRLRDDVVLYALRGRVETSSPESTGGYVPDLSRLR